MWVRNELFQKFGITWANLSEVCHPQSWRGHMSSFWEISLFSWSKQHVHSFFCSFQIHPIKLCTIVLRLIFWNNNRLKIKKIKKNTHIGHHIRLGNTWNYISKQQFNLLKNPTCLEFEIFLMLFWPHGKVYSFWGLGYVDV